MPDYPEDLKYTTEHEWVRSGNGTTVRVGHHRVRRRAARRHRLRHRCRRWARPSPPVTRAASWSRPRASPTSSARSPGVVSAVNPLLEANPETINSDPYGDGWLFELEIDDGRRSRRPARRRRVRRAGRQPDVVPSRPTCRDQGSKLCDQLAYEICRGHRREEVEIDMPFCTNCGHDNPEGSNFCGQCGARPDSRAGAAAESGRRGPTGDTTKTIPADGRRARRRGTDRRGRGRGQRAAPRLGAADRAARAQRRQPLPAEHRPGHRRPAPGLRHLPRRHLGVATARHLHPDAGRHRGEGPAAA